MNDLLLRNGVHMPLLGYGVFRILDAVQCERCVAEALQTGYRLIDTAASYFNEEAVGNAVRTSGIPREELFLTTKLWIQDSGYENTLRAFDDSLKKLALEKLYREGCIRAIGVSNFEPDRLADLCLNHEIAPMVNQVEIHPFHQQPAAVKVMKTFGVQPQTWGPLAEGQRNIFNEKRLKQIGAKYGKTAAQVALRWLLQRGIPAIPKNIHGERMKENRDILHLELNQRDMDKISGMDIGHSEVVDVRSVSTAKWLNGWKIHA